MKHEEKAISESLECMDWNDMRSFYAIINVALHKTACHVQTPARKFS